MKARELKPLDWVAYLGSYYQINFAGGDIMYLVGKKDYVPTSELSPIILTEEILEKNGWRENDEIWDIDYTYGKLNAEVWQWGKEMVTTISASVGNDVCTLAQIKYVHELQHILWALGMDDDLKI